MATVTGITAARAYEILGKSVVSGEINPTSGHLILTRSNGETIDAGDFTDIVTAVMEVKVAEQTEEQIDEKLPPAVSDAVYNGVAGMVFNRGHTSGAFSFAGVTNKTLVNALFRCTLTGNITINAANFPADPKPGTQFAMVLTQDSTGSRTLTLTGIKRSMGVLDLSTPANSVDIISFMYDGASWYAGAMGLRFS